MRFPNRSTIDDFQAILVELKRQGTNLNQIARLLNTIGNFGDAEKTAKVMNECWKSYRAITALGDDIKNAIIQRKRL